MKRDGLDLISHFGSRAPGLPARLAWKLATHRRLSRRARKFIRKNIAARYPGPFDTSVDGLDFRSYPLENYCDRTVLGRSVLPETKERALILPRLTQRMVFVDIGANVGTYCLFVAGHCNDTARILAFEPHPRTFSKLQFNIGANGFQRVEAINVGIGAEKGRMQLFASGGTNIGTASVVPGVTDGRQQVDIRVERLPEALQSRFVRRVDLMKIDIEGFEDQALMPLLTQQYEALWPKALLIETVLRRHWRVDCVSALEALGYRIIGDTGENILLEHPDAAAEVSR